MNEILSPSTGLLNNLLHNVFGMTPIYFMNEPGWFRPLYILSESWQYTGWACSSIWPLSPASAAICMKPLRWMALPACSRSST